MENKINKFNFIKHQIASIRARIISLLEENHEISIICATILNYLDDIESFILNSHKYDNSPIAENIIDNIYKTIENIKNSRITKRNILNIQSTLSSLLEQIPSIESKKYTIEKELNDLKKSSANILLELKNKLEETQHTIDKQLEGAAQIGLAQAFLKRQKKLEKSKIIFLLMFFSGLSLIILASLHFVSTFEISTSNNPISIEAIIQHIFIKIYIIIPIVWATWFAARQYANVNKIAEDYAFKTTSAMSFVGYKKEVEHDTEMKRELLRTAINNFGENPTRLLNKKECVSPAQELFQAFELANEFYGKSKKDK